MESNAMKKYLLIILAVVFAAVSCEKIWVSNQELGVNSNRFNYESTEESDVNVAVLSNQDWTVAVLQGPEWLTLKDNSGSGPGTIHAHCTANTIPSARVGKLKITSASGKTIVVNIVQAGSEQKASDIPDEML